MDIIDRKIHGYRLDGNKDAKEGMDYLDHRLDSAEVKVFFEQARIKGEAQFEDDRGHNYTLFYHNNGGYEIKKRSGSSGGWF